MPPDTDVGLLPQPQGLADETALAALGSKLTTRTTVELARDRAATADELDLLSRHDNTRVRLAVAQNPGAKQRTVVRLANDASPSVRVAVARREDLTSAQVSHFAMDALTTVRLAALSNPQADFHTITMLSRDATETVRTAVLRTIRGGNLRFGLLARIIIDGPSDEHRRAAEASWTERAEEVKKWLALCHSWLVPATTPLEWVREAVAEPPFME